MNVITAALLKIENTLARIFKDNQKYYKFGEDDFLPNQMVQVVNDSGTARGCITKLTQFTHGSGFQIPEIADTQANKSQKFNAVLGDLSLNVSYFKCVSFRVLYSNDGQPAFIYPESTWKFRRKGQRFVYNELMGYKDRVKSQDVYLDEYDLTELPAERMQRISKQINSYGRQWGDVVYHFRKGAGLYQDIYSVPDYYSGLDDIESDAGISRLEKRNVLRGWKTPVIISTGPIDKFVKDDSGKTAYDKFTETVKKFASEDAAVALHLEGATNETKPEVKTIPIADIMDQTDKATDRVGRKVCRLMGVPPILVGFSTAGQLGNNQELVNTMDLFEMTVVDSQSLIKEALNKVFPDKDFSILPLGLWEVQPEVK